MTDHRETLLELDRRECGRSGWTRVHQTLKSIVLNVKTVSSWVRRSPSPMHRQGKDLKYEIGTEISEQLPFALVFDARGVMLRVTVVKELTPPPYTALGWDVPNIEDAVASLTEKGLQFERYPNMNLDQLGIWTAPGGSKVAWFRDPDGNTLSLSQH